MRRATTAGLVTAVAMATAALGGSCSWGGEGEGAPTGGAQNGGAGAGGVASGGAGGTGASGGVPSGGAAGTATEPCIWEGWQRHPRLPAGCTGLCVPDDLATRLPKIDWVPKPSWCSGCLWLATPWAKAGERTVAPGLFAIGPGVQLFILGISPPKEAGMAGWYRGDGTPVAGWRFNADAGCGWLSGLAVSAADGVMGVSFQTVPEEDEHYVVRPLANVGALMNATDTTLLFPTTFKKNELGSEASLSSKRVALFFLGRTAMGDLSTGALAWVDEVSGAPQGGQLTPGPVVDNMVFVNRYLTYRSECWVESGGKLSLFMGDDSHDIRQFVSDGTHFVWVEGTNPVASDGGTTFTKYDLFKAAFGADPKQIVPVLLKADVPATLRSLTIANGFVSGTYLTQVTPTQKSASMVVRLSDGAAWRSILPDGYNWGDGTFPSPNELWGAAIPGVLAGKAESLIRIPYASMEILQ